MGASAACTLVGLPAELQWEVLLRLDGPSLSRVGQTCTAMHATALDDLLWRSLTISRFRVSRDVAQSPRLLASGGATWRHLYTQWDVTQRMPTSRVSGPSFPAIARGRSTGALIWVTVHSADDCRLVRGAVRLRIVIQNIRPGRARMRFQPGALSVLLANGAVVRAMLADEAAFPAGQYAARVAQCAIERGDGARDEFAVDNADAPLWLHKDEFAVLRMHVKVPDASYEVDALERLVAIDAQVRWGDETPVRVSAVFRDKVLWDMYERLPGGSWVRANPMSSHA